MRGCEVADREGVGAYVDASKDGAPLYAKHGFVDRSPATAVVGMRTEHIEVYVVPRASTNSQTVTQQVSG
jgi:hypothetical protein